MNLKLCKALGLAILVMCDVLYGPCFASLTSGKIEKAQKAY